MGALPEQSAEFGFGAGLSQKEDSWLSAGGFGTLHNCAQDKTGAVTKLPGYTSFSPSTVRNGDASGGIAGKVLDLFTNSLGNGPKLLKRGDLVGAVTRGLLYAKTDKWELQGRVSPWVCEDRTICRTDGARFDCCRSGNWVYSAFEQLSGGVRIVATYLPTNETVTLFAGGNIPTSGLTDPRIVAIDNAGTAILLYMNGAQGRYHVVTPDGVGIASNITMTTGYDVASDPVGGFIWLAFFPAVPNAIITSTRYRFSSGTLLLSATSTFPGRNDVVTCAICVDVASNVLVFCWVEYIASGFGDFNATVFARSASLDYATTLWTATVWTSPVHGPVPGSHDIPNMGVAFDSFFGSMVVFSDLLRNRVIGVWIDTSGVVEGGGGPGVLSGEVVAPCVFLRSRPVWDVTTQRMVFLADGGTTSLSGRPRRIHFVLGIEPKSAAGRAAPTQQHFGILGCFSYLTAGNLSTFAIGTGNPERISRPFQDASGEWHFQSFEIGGQASTLQLLHDYKMSVDERVATFAELGKATYLNGAVISLWDGVRCYEATFGLDPDVPGVAPAAAGSLANGNYTVAVTYARLTASGEIIRSRPSFTATGTISVLGTQSLQTSALHPGPSNTIEPDNNNAVFVEFWRSEVNTTSPLYFAGRTFVDVHSSAVVTFTDGVTSHAGNEQLYSDGTNGEIANTAAPSPLSICQWRNRLWATDGEQIFYTKEAANTRAAEWSQAFFVMSRGAPERLTSVAPLGEALMALAEDSSFYAYGDGPGANGDGSTLVGPMPAITELGCTQPAGIAQLPDGLLVPTRRGLQLLNGKREYSYIGAAIEDTLAAFPRVRCARHISGTNRVWISLATQDLTSGIAVIYDTFHKTFSTALNTSELLGLTHCSSIDVNGAHSFADQFGFVYDQTPGNYIITQAGFPSRYAQVIETPWFKANGPSGEIRIRRFIALMKRMDSTSQLQIQIGYDYEDTYHYSISLGHVGGYGDFNGMEGDPNELKLRIAFPRQRCQAYRLKFTEVPAALVSSAGFRFASLRMTTSLRPGSGKLLSKLNSPSAFTKT